MGDRYPNSVKAHALLEYALDTKGAVVQNNLQEVLFRHYFTDGLYPDLVNLEAAAVEVGLDAKEAVAYLQTPQASTQARAKAAANSQNGISGVPFFYINGQPAFSGAQPPERFVREFNRL